MSLEAKSVWSICFNQYTGGGCSTYLSCFFLYKLMHNKENIMYNSNISVPINFTN